MPDIKLIYSNAKPDKPRKVRQLPKVSPFCPVCQSNAWMTINLGQANMEGMKASRVRCCVHCLANNKVTTW